MNTVYRIQFETDETIGAYSFWQHPVCGRMSKAHNTCNDHPSPYQDIGMIGHDVKPDEYCGCETPAKLLKWFKGFIPNLLQAGFEIVKLTNVTITGRGEHQVLFEFAED